jgi:hypothetical protein
LLASLGSFYSVSGEPGEDWLTGWSHRKQHLIQGSTAGVQTNYQMKIVTHYGSGTDYDENAKSPPEGHVYLGLPGEDLSQWEISVNSSIYASYGLTYPLTYVFNISTPPKVYCRSLYGQSWTLLPEKTENDFFNGINAVRFDASNNRAYVSVAFSELSSNIYLNFTDAYDRPIEARFIEIAKYYDNRKAVVVATADDWTNAWDNDFKWACYLFRSRNLWLTAAIITAQAPWASIQGELDAGYIEPASHSYNHPAIPYADYDLQIGGSKQDIIGNLTLPALNRIGSTQYVWAWIEPYGNETDATCRHKLGEYKYLCDRDYYAPNDTFASWDQTNGLYERIGSSVIVDWDLTREQYNSKFDQVYNSGGIYHIILHPWSNQTYHDSFREHLDYIKERKDVWYAGFGHLYVYHFAQERGLVSVSPLGGARADFGDVRFTDSDGTTLLDYWMEKKVVGDYAVFWVKMPNIPASPNNSTIYIYYSNPDATTTSDGEKTFMFFDDFEGSSLNVTKWSVDASLKYSIGNSQLNITDVNFWGGLRAIGYTPLQSGFAMECKGVYYENIADGAVELLAQFANENVGWIMQQGYGDYWGGWGQSTAAYLAGIESIGYWTGWNAVPSPSTHEFKIQKDQNNNASIYLDKILILGPVTSSTRIDHFLFTVYKSSVFVCSKTAMDAVIIRRYCNPEPLHGTTIPPQYSNVTISITGQGTTDPAPGNYPQTYLQGNNLAINVAPASGWTFDHITRNGNPITGTTITNLGQTENIVVVFVQAPPPQYSNVTISITGQGTTDPAPGNYPQKYVQGTDLTITATPATGWGFKNLTRNGVPQTDLTVKGLGATENLVVTFEQVSQDNLIQNPSVEEDSNHDGIPDGWLLQKMWGQGITGDLIWDTDAHSGSRSLRANEQQNQSAEQWHYLAWMMEIDLNSPSYISLTRGNNYTLRCWYKTLNGAARIRVRMFDNNWMFLGESIGSGPLNSTAWTQTPWITFTVPQQARWFQIEFAIPLSDINSGATQASIWADDFEIYKTSPP